MYQDWKKRQNPEAHFVQAPVDAVTGEHVAVLPQSVQKIDDTSTAMDVDPTDASAPATRMATLIATSMKRTPSTMTMGTWSSPCVMSHLLRLF